MFFKDLFQNEIDIVKKHAAKNGYVSISELETIFHHPSEDDLDGITDELEKIGVDILYEESNTNPIEIWSEDFVATMDEPSQSELEEASLMSNAKESNPSDCIQIYLNEIGEVPLLSAEEEIKYSLQVQNGLALQKKDTITKEENIIIEKGQQAQNIMTEANLRLVVSIAKRYLGRGLELMDLIQEGNMGLMKAVIKFDPSLGNRFATYATCWIKQSILRAIADEARTIRIPVHMLELMTKVTHVEQDLVQKLKHTPTLEEIANAMGLDVAEISRIKELGYEQVSLDQVISIDDDLDLYGMIPDPTILNPMEYTQNEIYKEKLDLLLSTLSDREQRIIRLRYGFYDNYCHTFEEIGKEFGVSRERIQQIEDRAMMKLRHPARLRRLKQYRVG
jgi:RNA polymerase primary sigma factor